MEESKSIEELAKEREEFNQIAKSLADDYMTIYYIEIESGRYTEFSHSDVYESMNVPRHWEDFYKETRDNAIKYVHPDDREFAEGLYYKEKMLENLKGKKSFSYKYRVMVSGQPRYFRFTVIRADDGKHIVLCVKDINDEMTAETVQKKNQITFGQIAESLASNYDVIYYVNTSDASYVGYTTNNIYGKLEVHNEGQDFFRESKNIMSLIVHPQDAKKVREVLSKDYMLSALVDRKQFSIDYRLIIENEPQYTRLTARKSSDKEHFIIGVENINDEALKEKAHLKELSREKELARRDELTGVKNKTAYAELESGVQEKIDKGLEYHPFAIAICDINWLKIVNDTEGHKAGDEYIKAASKLICDVFSHSPVFRIGGDEFAVFLGGSDYPEREELIKKLRNQVSANKESGSGPVIAVGLAEFEPGNDTKVADVFERADNLMYEDKRRIKDNGRI
ncbi:MAG: diguanylate cyclase [Lachnospiraceae bacterium]|nr:diguanylate cyclase [Lachnospiraceae bacterium]